MIGLAKIIDDKRILRLVGLILRSGIMKDGLVTPSLEGSVQGSQLSPLLSNVVLDELDKELEARGLEFCRFADDCNIFVRSRKSAERVMKRIKELTPRGTHQKLEKTMEAINRWYRGWSSYYSLTQFPSQFENLEAHIRRRLRSRIIDQQKSHRNLFNKLRSRGVSRRMAANFVFTNNTRWALSHCRAVETAYSNKYFIGELKQFIRSTENRDHWFSLRRWSRLM